jgi:hypothetical protein
LRRWILSLSLAWLVALWPVPGAAPAWAAEYLTSVSDLPLADGLKEQADKSTVFDTPLGRIVTAYAAGNLKPEAVLDFYGDTLPQLGWEKQKTGTYRRKHDVLKIDVWGPDEGPCKVSFTLSSQNQ